MNHPNTVTTSSLLLLLLFCLVPTIAQGQSKILLSKHADFSTEDRSFDPNDVLHVKVIAPNIDFTDLDKNEFRLKPDEGDNDIEKALTNNLNGTYTTYVDLSTTDMREDDWEVRIRIEDENDQGFEARVDINIGNEDRNDDDFDDDELEFTGRIEALEAGSITVDGIRFVVNASTAVLDDNNNPIDYTTLSVGQIVEIRGDRNNEGMLLATEIKIEDDFPNGGGDNDELEFTGVIDALDAMSITVTGTTFTVGSNTIVLDDNNNPISFSDLFVGQIVEIRGDLQGDGTWLATHIKVEDDIIGNDEIEFTGHIDSLDNNTITVNGTTFTVDQNTVVLDNDNQPIDYMTLVAGQLVEIKGRRQADGRILAVRIKLEDRNDDEVELTGAIESIDGNSLVVAGLTFLVNDLTVILDNDNLSITFADLSVGLIVEIRADVQGDGSLLASDIKIEDRLEDEVEVRGLADSVGDSSIVVLGRLFNVVPSTEIVDNNDVPVALTAFVAGSIVEVKASLLPGGILIARRIEQEDNEPLRVRVQGPIDAVNTDTLNVAGILLQLNNATEVIDQQGNAATINDLAVGQSVDVDAQGQTSGMPVATRVEIKKVANVTGSIASLIDNQLVMAGTSISVNANTLVLGSRNEVLSLTAIKAGQIARVRAEIAGASLQATTVELLASGVLSVSVEDEQGLPRIFTLNQNYPNPFNPVTTISFDVFGAENANVSLSIYNVLGQRVRTILSNEVLTGGHYAFEWDGRDNAGQQLASGMYLYQLKVNTLVQSKAMVLMK